MTVRRNNSILFFFLVLLSVSSVSGFICRVGDVNINKTYHYNNTLWNSTGNFIYPWDLNYRLGIGNATPTQRLHVQGNINFTGQIYGNGSQLLGVGAIYSNITPITLTGTTFSLQNCADNQILKMDGISWNCEADDNTDTQDLSYNSGTDVISLVNGGSIDITEVDTDTTYSNLSEFTDDLGDRGYTNLGNFTDNLGSRGYTHLGNFTDNLGARGYTHLSNFSDDIGVSSDWDEISDVPTATPSNGDTTHLSTADQIYDWVISLAYATTTYVDSLVASIGNWSQDKGDYYNKTQVYNTSDVYQKTEIDTQGEMEAIWSVTLSTDTERTTGLAAQDECSEIANCVDNAWDADGDIAVDEISESKINFVTACAAGNHYYLNGNDLACEVDDVDDAIASCTEVNVCTIDAESMEGVDFGTMTDTKWCVYDLAGTEVDCNVEPVVNTDTQDLSYNAGTDVISLVDGGSIDITEVDTDTTYSNTTPIHLSGTTFSLQTCADNQIYKMNGAVWNCEVDDDTNYSNLSDFTDDLGDRGYTHLSNFTDNIGVSSDWDAIGDVPVANITNGDNTHLALVDDIYDWVIGLAYATTNYVDNLISSVGNWTQDKSNYYNSSEVYNKTEIDTQGEVETIWSVTLSTDSERTTGLAAQDECNEITNCVPSAWDSASDVGANVLNGTHILESDLSVDAVSMEGTDWGTMTNAKWCVYDSGSTEVDCNVNPVVNTDTQDLSYDSGTDVISLVDGGSIDITEVDTNTNANTVCAGGTTYMDGEGNCDTGDATGACASNAICLGGHTHSASQITAGTFGTGNYVMDTNLTVETIVFENGGSFTSNGTHIIWS